MNLTKVFKIQHILTIAGGMMKSAVIFDFHSIRGRKVQPVDFDK